MIRIELGPKLLAWTDENVGENRQADSVKRKLVGRYGASNDPEESLRKNILGGRCEAVSWKWAKPVEWHWECGRYGLPDLHDFIDVKGVDNPNHNLMIRQGNADEYAYLLVDGSDHPFYDIVGWCWGFEGKTLPLETRGTNRDPCHFVDRDNPMMKEPELLLLVLRERQEFPERAIALAASGVLPSPSALLPSE